MLKRIIVLMLPAVTFLLPWSPAAAEPDSTGGGVPSASTPTVVPQDADMLSKDVLVVWAESQLDADENPASTPLTCAAGEICPSGDSKYLAVVNHMGRARVMEAQSAEQRQELSSGHHG